MEGGQLEGAMDVRLSECNHDLFGICWGLPSSFTIELSSNRSSTQFPTAPLSPRFFSASTDATLSLWSLTTDEAPTSPTIAFTVTTSLCKCSHTATHVRGRSGAEYRRGRCNRLIKSDPNTWYCSSDTQLL